MFLIFAFAQLNAKMSFNGLGNYERLASFVGKRSASSRSIEKSADESDAVNFAVFCVEDRKSETCCGLYLAPISTS